MFHRAVFTYGDLAGSYVPRLWWYSTVLASGDEFLWQPKVLSGFYAHGDGEGGFFHPVHWLLFKTLPFNVAFNLDFLFNYVWLYLGTYFLLRWWSMPRSAALYGAMVFAFGGYNLCKFSHLPNTAVISHLPWLVMLADQVVTATSWRRVVAAQAGVALLTCSQVLYGYPLNLFLQ